MNEEIKDYNKRNQEGSNDFSNENVKKVKKKTPKWLKNLEAQSWQAELLISGLVIAGLLQLPELFIRWVEGYILESSEMGYMFLNIASIFFLVSIDSLIIFFGFHFLFRAIWVALLGLNSVFPEGINVDSTSGAGPKYWKKAKEKYPDLSAYNLNLDKRCSLIFSLATVTIIMMSSFSVIILLIYQLFRFLISYFPIVADYVVHIGIGLYLLFSITAFTIQFLAKKYPDNKRVEKFADGFGTVAGTLFSFYIFQKPIGYITSIYTSNVKSKYFILIVMVISFFMGLAGAKQTNDNPIYEYFRTEKYFTFNNRPHQLFSFNYRNLKPEDLQIFTPIITSDVVREDVLKVFIPTIAREKERLGLTELSLLEKLKTKRAIRDSIYRENLSKYADFNQIFVNEQGYQKLDFQYYAHPNAGEKGVMVYIPTSNFVEGKNMLEIRKNYFSKDGVQKIVKIPFYFAK